MSISNNPISNPALFTPVKPAAPETGQSAGKIAEHTGETPSVETSPVGTLPENVGAAATPQPANVPGSIQQSATNAKVEAELAILNRIDADFQALGGLTNIKSTIEISGNAGELAAIGKSIFDGINSLEVSVSKLQNWESTITGINVAANLTTGIAGTVQLAALIPKAQEWNKLTTLIDAKKQEIADLPNQNHDPKFVKDRTAQLTREVETLQDAKNEMAKETALGLLNTGIGFTSDTLTTASSLVSLFAPSAGQASNILGATGNVVGVAGSAVAVGISLYSLYQDSKEIRSVLAETDRLLEKQQKGNLDPAVATVIDMRLKALEQMFNDAIISTTQDALTLGCSVVGGAAAVTTIGLAVAGSTAGLAATTAATAGIGVAVVGVALLAGGIGYAAYKNRKVIELKLEQTSQKAQAKIGEKRVESSRKEIRKSDKALNDVQNKIKNIRMDMESKKQVFLKEIETHEAELIKLTSAMNKPRNSSPEIQGRIKKLLDSERQATLNTYKKIDQLEQKTLKMLEKEVDKHSNISENVNFLSRKITQLKVGIQDRKKQAQLLEVQGKLEKLSLKFSKTTPEDLKNMASDLIDDFQKRPESQKEVKSFIYGEGFVVTEFDKSPISNLFSYFTKSAEAEVAA